MTASNGLTQEFVTKKHTFTFDPVATIISLAKEITTNLQRFSITLRGRHSQP
jgi:hypothetical protein